ncbi:MAG: 50S ribosomal protein L19 [Candidatus Adiutrix sp.]
MDPIFHINQEQLRLDLPSFRVGDTVAVSVKIKEGDKERIQIFKGVVIRRRKGTTDASFTVRKISYGIGVERIFPASSPNIEKVEIISEGKVRRARLYYLRNLRGKAAKVKTKNKFFTTAK